MSLALITALATIAAVQTVLPQTATLVRQGIALAAAGALIGLADPQDVKRMGRPRSRSPRAPHISAVHQSRACEGSVRNFTVLSVRVRYGLRHVHAQTVCRAAGG